MGFFGHWGVFRVAVGHLELVKDALDGVGLGEVKGPVGQL